MVSRPPMQAVVSAKIFFLGLQCQKLMLYNTIKIEQVTCYSNNWKTEPEATEKKSV